MNKNIRELVEKAIEDAMDVGAFSGLPLTPAKQRARHDQQESLAALLAAIDRLERKAAAAKAECEAWRKAFDDEDIEPSFVNVVGSDSTYVPKSVQEAVKRIDAARIATDEAWREPAPENKEPPRD